MALTFPTFGGQSFAPYWLQIVHPSQVAYSVYYSPDGTRHCFFAPFKVEYDLATGGLISSALFAALKAKLNTTGDLVATQGTCSARLVRCDGVPAPGDSGGGGHMVAISLGWVQLSAWS